MDEKEKRAWRKGFYTGLFTMVILNFIHFIFPKIMGLLYGWPN